MALCHSFPIQHSLGTGKMETQQVMTSIQAVFFLLILEIGQIDTTAACHWKKSTSENRSMLTQFNRWIGGGSWESHQGLMVKQSCIIPERACSRSMLDWYFMGMGQNDLSPKIITSDSFWDVQEGYSIFFDRCGWPRKKCGSTMAFKSSFWLFHTIIF